MIKSIALAYRTAGMTREEYNKYWLKQHGPMAARMIPGLRKYVQNHPIQLPGQKNEFNGFAEIWFDDVEAFQGYLAWRQTDEAKALLDDEDNYVDIGRSIRYIVEEHFFK